MEEKRIYLRLKLIYYILNRTREFILSHYDLESAEIVTNHEIEEQGLQSKCHMMMPYLFETMEQFSKNRTVDMEFITRLSSRTKRIYTAMDQFLFARDEIPIYLSEIRVLIRYSHPV
ncbi:TPA: hypothetical protein ACU0L4_000149 [Streptococcus suis]